MKMKQEEVYEIIEELRAVSTAIIQKLEQRAIYKSETINLAQLKNKS